MRGLFLFYLLRWLLVISRNTLVYWIRVLLMVRKCTEKLIILLLLSVQVIIILLHVVIILTLVHITYWFVSLIIIIILLRRFDVMRLDEFLRFSLDYVWLLLLHIVIHITHIWILVHRLIGIVICLFRFFSELFEFLHFSLHIIIYWTHHWFVFHVFNFIEDLVLFRFFWRK